MERKGQYAIGPLVFEVERSGAPERRQQRIAWKGARRKIDEQLGQLERFRPLVAVEPEHEVRLDVRHVSQDHVYVFGYLPHLVHSFVLARLGLAAEVVP